MYQEFMKDKEIKLLAIDLDDTLLRSDNKVSKRTAQAIRRAREMGIFVIIATGRMHATAKPVSKELQMGDVPIVLYSGGTVQRVHSGSLISEKPIEKDVAEDIIKLCKSNDWYVQAYVNDELLVEEHSDKTKEYERDTGANAKVVGEKLSELEAAPIKLLIIEEKEQLEKIAKLLKELFGNTIQAMRSKDNYLEVIATGVSKGSAVLDLAEKLDITHDQIMAFGNAQNDISMLEEAAVAVAMGNADERVKAMADIVTDTNNEDGVAKIIEKYILKINNAE